MDTGCNLEDLLEEIDNRDGGQERVREIHHMQKSQKKKSTFFKADKTACV